MKAQGNGFMTLDLPAKLEFTKLKTYASKDNANRIKATHKNERSYLYIST